MPRTIHIIGAGLAGLSAAVDLTGRGETVVVHEATAVAGGRCRSYHDAALGMMIDNGNHLLLSGNHAALAICARSAPSSAWSARPGPSFLRRSRQPRTAGRCASTTAGCRGGSSMPTQARARHPRARLSAAGPAAVGRPTRRSARSSGSAATLYERLVRPLLLAALNIDPAVGSARLAGAVIRETLAAGGAACRPLIAREGLGATLIEPALAFLRSTTARLRFGHQLHALRHAGSKVEALDFGSETIRLAPEDAVILAVPPYAAAAIVPGLETPTEFRAIVNAHFRIEPPPGQPPILGVLNATTEWIFAFPGRLSVTISAADRLIDTPRDTLAHTIWSEVASRHRPAARRCRPGRSCASGARPLPPRPSRTRGARAPRPPGAIWSWPAIGPIPACRPRSKVPSDPAIAPPISSPNRRLHTRNEAR